MWGLIVSLAMQAAGITDGIFLQLLCTRCAVSPSALSWLLPHPLLSVHGHLQGHIGHYKPIMQHVRAPGHLSSQRSVC